MKERKEERRGRMVAKGNGHLGKQLKNMREAGKRHEQNLRSEGRDFEGKIPDRVLGLILYGEMVQAHYSVGVAISDIEADIVEEDVTKMYEMNIAGDARRWARELATQEVESLKYLDI